MKAMRETTVTIPLSALGVGGAAVLLAQVWLLQLDELAAILGFPVSVAGALTAAAGGWETARRLVRRQGSSRDADRPADRILVGLIVVTVLVVIFFSAWAL